VGLVCEAACLSTEVPYFGGEKSPPAPKEKTPTLVTLVAEPTLGSEFGGWEGCGSESEGKCVVSMVSARTVTAKFE